MTPIIQAAFLFLGAQLYFAIDGLRTTVALIQTAQAVSARDIARFDSVKVQRDAELNDLHRQIAELTTAVAVLREGVKK